MKDAANCEKPRGVVADIDPGVSEWGNPAGATPPSRSEHIGARGDTQGSETSQYLEEKTSTRDSVSSGERKRKRPNRKACFPGLRERDTARFIERGTVWKVRPQRVKAPYPKSMIGPANSQVPRDT